MIEVRLALGPSTSVPRKCIVFLMLLMGYFGHIGLIVQNPPLYSIIFGIIWLAMLVVLYLVVVVVMVDVVWVLLPPTSPTRKLITVLMVIFFASSRSGDYVVGAAGGDGKCGVGPGITHFSYHKVDLSQTCVMGDYVHTGLITQLPSSYHIGVGITKLVLLVLLYFLLLLVMVDVMWVLGTPTSPPINFIVCLMVVISCCVENLDCGNTFVASGNSICGVSTRTIYLSTQKVNSATVMNDRGF